MPNFVNKMVVRELSDSLKGADGMLIVSLAGLTMLENETVRSALAEKGVPLRVVPNRLALIALKDCGLDFPAEAFKGNTAVAWGDAEHAIHAAKVFTEPEIKKTGKVSVNAALLEGRVLDQQEALALADLPDRDSLNAMLLGVLQGPARNLASLLHTATGSIARVLQARVDKGEGEE